MILPTQSIRMELRLGGVIHALLVDRVLPTFRSNPLHLITVVNCSWRFPS